MALCGRLLSQPASCDGSPGGHDRLPTATRRWPSLLLPVENSRHCLPSSTRRYSKLRRRVKLSRRNPLPTACWHVCEVVATCGASFSGGTQRLMDAEEMPMVYSHGSSTSETRLLAWLLPCKGNRRQPLRGVLPDQTRVGSLEDRARVDRRIPPRITAWQ